ncbi:hypothetical protein [Nodularia sp. NIES-3585]|uniref:hypothetical protein n=1 Tax=Nodularia sp. NIES-3585 TaxID=1973477 RepID=UPI000B5C775A|nr:hypothetical protein [Nodularia sp. NIES-3585]GAX37661.1 hypothetical protein NIES3585_37060 [Nodularia sp. NIES-3585]
MLHNFQKEKSTIKNSVTFFTKTDLKAIGFSEYLIKDICKGLAFVFLEVGVRGYNRSDLKAAIMNKLSQTNIRLQTRKNLQTALSLVDEKSNVIEVDFLGKLTLEERIDFLKNNREELRTKGELMLQDINEILNQARNLSR